MLNFNLNFNHYNYYHCIFIINKYLHSVSSKIKQGPSKDNHTQETQTFFTWGAQTGKNPTSFLKINQYNSSTIPNIKINPRIGEVFHASQESIERVANLPRE